MTDQLAERVTAREAAASLRADALAALAQFEAAAAAVEAEREAIRIDRAETAIHQAVRAVIGPDAYFEVVGDIDTGPLPGDQFPAPGRFSATIRTGELTLMVGRADEFCPTNVALLVACPDCGHEHMAAEYLTSLVELGRALRDAEQPCGDCRRGAWATDEAAEHKAWVITKVFDEQQAADVANLWESEGYEVFVRACPDGECLAYVVSGHRFEGAAWG